MIKNERQYRITKAQVDKFSSALSRIEAASGTVEMHPIERQLHEDALRSQLGELQTQLAEYDALRSGEYKVLAVESFLALPRALIQARIAAGLSQRELAERLGLKEQQIQQYESTEYSAASMSRVQEVINALGILVREDVFLPSAEVTKDNLLKRMQGIGIDRDLILDRILPKTLAARLKTSSSPDDFSYGGLVLHASAIIGRIFNLTSSAIFSSATLQLNTASLGTARFKLPARVDEGRVSAYTVYAHYLSLLALDVTRDLKTKAIPTDAETVNRDIVSIYGSITFENALRYVWSLGIPVLPLADSGNFFGACWRVNQRNIIVLKQQARFPARWLNDLLHELGHTGQKPEEPEHSVVEAEDILENYHKSEEEEEVRYFADDVTFNGRAEEIAEMCFQQSRYIEGLSRVVPLVAASENVPSDALAYYIAYSLSLASKNWWGAATNLQDKSVDPLDIARKVFLEYANFDYINEGDRSLLQQALEN